MTKNDPPICTSYVTRLTIKHNMTEYRTYIYNRQNANLSKSFELGIS